MPVKAPKAPEERVAHSRELIIRGPAKFPNGVERGEVMRGATSAGNGW